MFSADFNSCQFAYVRIRFSCVFVLVVVSLVIATSTNVCLVYYVPVSKTTLLWCSWPNCIVNVSIKHHRQSLNYQNLRHLLM